MLHMDSSDTSHHEDTPAITMYQIEARDRIVEVINKGINPFTTTTKDLINITTGQIASQNVATSLLCAKELDTEAICNYLSGEHQTLKIIKLKTFATVHERKAKNPVVKIKDNLNNEITMLKRVLLAKENKLNTKSENFQ